MSDSLLGMNGLGIASMRGSAAAVNASRERTEQAAALANGTHRVSPRTMRQIEQTAQEFESVFLAQMLEYSFQDISPNPLGNDEGGGFADDTYRSMLLGEYAKRMSNAGGIGIADHVKRTMLQAQEATYVR